MITIGLDLGTTTISGAVYDSERKEVLATRTLLNDGKIKAEHVWLDLQDPEIIWETCQTLLKEFLNQFPAIKGIGLSGQMHGIIYVDKDGQAVSPLVTWQDGRGDRPYQDGESYADYLTKQSGYPMATGYGLTTHFYNLLNGLVPKEAVSFCTIADYIGMQLTKQKKPMMHASQAQGFGMFDMQKMDFDLKAVSEAGIDPYILPEVAVGEKIIGMTVEGFAVWAAIGDNQAGFLGAAGMEDSILVNIGTSSQLSARSETLVTVEGLDTRPFVRGEYLLVGAGLCGGSAYALLRDLVLEVLEIFEADAEGEIYHQLEEAAKRVMDEAHHLQIDTRFRGSRNNPELRGAITQIGMDNLSIGHLAVGVMRGICEELYGFYEIVPEALRASEAIIGVGNALRHNATLRTILAERFGKNFSFCKYEEEGAIGASKLAQHKPN